MKKIEIHNITQFISFYDWLKVLNKKDVKFWINTVIIYEKD